MKYRVKIKEVSIGEVEIEADCIEDAIDEAKAEAFENGYIEVDDEMKILAINEIN